MGGGDIDLSTIPLMTKAQEGALAELLPAVMGMMSGFPLGEAYQPGAYNVRAFPEFTGEHIVKRDGDEDGDRRDKITRRQLVAPTGVDGGDGRREVFRDRAVMPRSEDGGAIPPPTGGAVDGGQIPEPVLDLILNPPPPPGIQPPGYRAIRPGEDPEAYQKEMAAGGTFISQRPPTGAVAPPATGGIAAPGTIGGPVTPPSTAMSGGKAPETQPISPVQQTLTEPFVGPFREGMTGNYPRREVTRREVRR